MADFLWTYELNFFRYILCFFRAHRDIWMVIKIVKIPTGSVWVITVKLIQDPIS